MNERSFILLCNPFLSRFSGVCVRNRRGWGFKPDTSDFSVHWAEMSPDCFMARRHNAKEGESVGRRRILALARSLFWQHGYHAVSMRDLARAYGCQPANLYNYFKTKEAILFEVFLEEMEHIVGPIAHLEEAVDGDPVDQLRLIIFNHLQVTLSHRRSAKMLFDVALDRLSPAHRRVILSMRDKYDCIIRKVFERGRDKGVFLPLDSKLIGFMISSMVVRCRIWFRPRKGVTIDELADFIFQFALRGILNAEWNGEHVH